MPSPFPGMDPFLERSRFFPSVHDSFIVYLSEALQSSLSDPYFVEINRRAWVDTVERPVEADIFVGHNSSTQPIIVTVPVEHRRETYLEIRVPSSEGERVVTTLEVLSLTNKTPGQGRTLFLKKQREILDSDVHLVEIDLLRDGTHSTAVPLAPLKKAPPFDYHVCIRHFDKPEDYHAYTFTLREPLPTIAVPLLPGDAAVSINLQAVFDRCYDTGPYRRRVVYDPARFTPALSSDQAEWVSQLLRDKGLSRTEDKK
jgi:Protein of unknown function (DUF4058)